MDQAREWSLAVRIPPGEGAVQLWARLAEIPVALGRIEVRLVFSSESGQTRIEALQ